MKRVPIKVARDVAKVIGAKQVILCAWDGELTHVVTYGVSVQDCAQAAQGGNLVKRAMGWPEELCNAKPSRVRALPEREPLRCTHTYGCAVPGKCVAEGRCGYAPLAAPESAS